MAAGRADWPRSAAWAVQEWLPGRNLIWRCMRMALFGKPLTMAVWCGELVFVSNKKDA